MAITLLSGPESFLKDEALNKLKQTLASDGNLDLNYDIFYGENPDADFFAVLKTTDFFGKNKLVVIRNVDRLSEPQKERLLTYVKKPSPNTHLVLETVHINLRENFLSTLAGYAEVIECNKLLSQELYNWIYKRAHSYKKRISKEARELLLELKGNDLRSLAMELDKLVSYLGDKAQITRQDVEDLVGRDLTHDIFDLIDAISRRDYEQSLNLISLLTRNRRRDSEIIGLLGWQFRRLWKAKQLQEDKTTRFHMGRVLKIPSRYIEKFLSQLNNFDIDDIKRNLKILVEADRDLKTGGKKRDLTLELVMIRLCSA